MPHIHQLALPVHAHEKLRDLAQRLLRRGQSNALKSSAQLLQSLQRQRQMRPPLIPRQRMNLINNHRLDRLEHLAPTPRGQQDVQRLGRRDENVRRLAQHRRPLRLRRIPGAHRYSNLRKLRIQLRQLAQRRLQILLHVVAQRPQWRDVQDMSLVAQPAPLARKRIDGPQVRSDGLPHARGRGDERMSS
jgi:hypothetical protein